MMNELASLSTFKLCCYFLAKHVAQTSLAYIKPNLISISFAVIHTKPG